MPKINNLQRRKSAWYVRVRIPKNLVDAYKPKKEICYSLGTSDYATAKKRVHNEVLKIQAGFDEKLRGMKAAAKDADMLSKYANHELEGLVLRWLSEAEKKAAKASAKKTAWLKKEGLDEDDALDAADIQATLEDDAGRTLDEAKGISRESIHYGRTAAAKFLKERGVTFNPKSSVFKKLGDMFSKATYAAAHHHLREWKGQPYLPADPLFAQHMSNSSYPVSSGAVVGVEKKRTLQQVIDEYMSNPEKHRGLSTQKNYAIVYRALKELLGADTYIHEITRDDIKHIRDVLLKTPANATKVAPGKTLEEAAKLAAKNGWSITAPSTVNSHLSKLNALLNFAEKEGYIQKNHGKGLSVADKVKKKDKRNAFTIEHLNRIFSAPLYTGCQDDGNGYNTAGAAKPRNARFWAPVVSLYTGMRLNEICQLHVADIAVKAGIDVIIVTEEDLEDEVSEGAKSTKTESGERFIPIHPELKKLGFMKFVEQTRDAGHKRLFPELKYGPGGYYSGDMSKWFARFLDNVGITGKKYVFHSFRHTFRDALRRAEIPRDVALQLGGWSDPPPINESRNSYGNAIHNGLFKGGAGYGTQAFYGGADYRQAA